MQLKGQNSKNLTSQIFYYYKTKNTLKLYNNNGSGTEGTDAQKCSTIPSGLKVYYNCDSATVINNLVDYSDLPENTLFEETDTYKTFWLQDNIWKDQLYPYIINPNTYGSSSGWVDNSDDMALDTTNNGITFTDVNSVGGISRALPENLETNWVCKFHFNLSELDGNDTSLITFTTDYTTHWGTSANEVLIVQCQGANYWRFTFILNDNGSNSEATTSNNTFALNTTKSSGCSPVYTHFSPPIILPLQNPKASKCF